MIGALQSVISKSASQGIAPSVDGADGVDKIGLLWT